MVEKSAKQVKVRKNPQVENREEVVAFEQTEYMVRKKVNNNSSVFLSKSQRPDYFVMEHTSKMLGPGTYTNSSGQSKQLNEKMLSPRSSMHYSLAPLDIERSDTKSSELGPGCYKF